MLLGILKTCTALKCCLKLNRELPLPASLNVLKVSGAVLGEVLLSGSQFKASEDVEFAKLIWPIG
jgi:hypothetical protein